MIKVFIWLCIKLCLNNWNSIACRKLNDLPTAWLKYLWDHVVLSRPSVGSIRVYEPYSLSFFPMDFGPSGHFVTMSWPPCFPSVKRTSIASYFVIFRAPLSSSKPFLHCEFILQKFEESHDILLIAWTVCSFLGFAPPQLACWDCLQGCEFILTIIC